MISHDTQALVFSIYYQQLDLNQMISMTAAFFNLFKYIKAISYQTSYMLERENFRRFNLLEGLRRQVERRLCRHRLILFRPSPAEK